MSKHQTTTYLVITLISLSCYGFPTPLFIVRFFVFQDSDSEESEDEEEEKANQVSSKKLGRSLK